MWTKKASSECVIFQACRKELDFRSEASSQLATEECASSVEVSIIRLNASMLMVREHNIPCSCWPFLRWWEWDKVGCCHCLFGHISCLEMAGFFSEIWMEMDFMSWIHGAKPSPKLSPFNQKGMATFPVVECFGSYTQVGQCPTKPFFFFSQLLFFGRIPGKKQEHPYIHHPSL